MKKSQLILLVLFAFLFSSCAKNIEQKQSGASTFIDDNGYEVAIDGIPQKVITLAPSLTEMIYELGVEKYLIGNTLYCDYPEEAKSVTKVGDMLKTDYERILELSPDLIFVSIEGNSKETYDRLKEFGFNIFISNPRDFEGIKKSYRDLAKIFNVEEKAEEQIKDWNQEVEAVIEKAAKFEDINAMFLISADPLMVAGENTFINKFLKMCNIKNIAENLVSNYPILSREEVLQRNPEYIFVSADHGLSTLNIKNLYPEWANIKAVQQNKIVIIDPNLYFRPGPRFPLALSKLFNTVEEMQN